MSVHKSIIEEIELESGASLYVQITNGRASISFDLHDISVAVWLTTEELDDLRKTISNALIQDK